MQHMMMDIISLCAFPQIGYLKLLFLSRFATPMGRPPAPVFAGTPNHPKFDSHFPKYAALAVLGLPLIAHRPTEGMISFSLTR